MPSSSIKGGGSATISSEAENEIIALLFDSRDKNNPLLPIDKEQPLRSISETTGTSETTPQSRATKIETKKKYNSEEVKKKAGLGTSNICFNDLSDHNKKKEKRRFLKKMVEFHNRQRLAARLNGEPLNNNDLGISSESVLNSSSTSQTSKVSSRPVATAAIGGSTTANNSQAATGKVRIDMVEAIYKSNNKKGGKGKSSKSKKKSKNESEWRQGQIRKTMVLTRSTTTKELLNTCKAKIQMKKKPIRLFYVDVNNKLEIDLDGDLSGLEDGALIFATSYRKEKDNDHPKDLKEATEECGSSLHETAVIVDELELVKKAYALRKRKKTRRRIPLTENNMGRIEDPLPLFATALERLEPLSKPRLELPAASYRKTILSALDTSRVLVICGETGCGKSTQVPQYILEGMKAIESASEANILVTQPRRVAATSLAMRVAKERNSPPPGKQGSEVGYNVRLAKAICESTTKIVYCTVGILLRMLVNPIEDNKDTINNATTSNDDEIDSHKNQTIPLSDISHVVIDEVHERDLNTDFVLTLLRPLLSINKRLSVILMSATASADLFVNYFRDNLQIETEPIVLRIPGRTYPVETYWLPDCEKLTSARLNGWTSQILEQKSTPATNDIDDCKFKLSPRATAKIDNDFLLKMIIKVSQQYGHIGGLSKPSCKENLKTNGAILIFLPGKGEIDTLMRTLYKDSFFANKRNCSILALHSSLSPAEQWRAFQPVQIGMLKIVLATNVAETSITIPDISIVIDTGRVKESRFNASTQIKELVTVWTSRASAKQRAGRAGRTGPGVCYKLYIEDFETSYMPLQTSPEMVRTPLDELVLQVCLLEEHRKTNNEGCSPVQFLRLAPEPPPTKSLLYACHHLMHIGALKLILKKPELIFRLTPLGYHLSHLPMDPKVGKILIVGSMLQCMEPALTVAATLSCSKRCWLPFIPGRKNSQQEAREKHENIVRNGFGGEDWDGGTVKGDLIGVIAAYNKWISSSNGEKERRKYATANALDHNALLEIKGLRRQFKDSLLDSGLWEESGGNTQSNNNDDALLTSCCLVAGLYPNVTTLMRPSRERRIRGGKLIVKGGNSFLPSSNSFQKTRVLNASETGKDAYAVFLSKHRNIGTTSSGEENKQPFSFLSEINFVSRFSLLLFGGEIRVCDNFLLVDEWLKFKVRSKTDNAILEDKDKKDNRSSEANAVLIQELRKELDNLMMKHVMFNGIEKDKTFNDECNRVIHVIRKLLSEE